MQIDGVPQKIHLNTILPLVEAMGIDPERACQINIGLNAVEVTVYAAPADGSRHHWLTSRVMPNDDFVARHTLTIPIVTDVDEVSA